MRDRQTNHGEPYRLLGRRLVFTNWFFVDQGGYRWIDDQNRTVTVRGDQQPLEAHFEPPSRSPRGTRLIIHSAVRQGPLAEFEQPWMKGGAIGNVLHDGGMYRAWYAGGWGDLEIFAPGRRPNQFLCYLESEDGWTWRTPRVGTIEFEGSRENNIVLPTPCFIGGGCSIFRDPGAPEAERYKLLGEWFQWDRALAEDFARRHPEKVDRRAWRPDLGPDVIMGPRAAVSPDGLHWHVFPEPLFLGPIDTQQVGYYDPHLRQYVLYTRDYAGLPRATEQEEDETRWFRTSRRAVARAVSADFRDWSRPELVLAAHGGMQPGESLYTNCYTTVPGAPEHHLMFPAVWNLSAHDETWIALATSHDGRLWEWAPAPPMLATGPAGAWDGGCVFAHPNLIELPNGDWALPYTGFNVPHKYPRARATRGSGYMVWPKGRLAGIEVAESGCFSTIPIVPSGRRLRINGLTRHAGTISVEIAGRGGDPLPGRDFSQAVELRGDLHWTPVRWNGHDTLGTQRGEEITIHVRARCATIYGFEFD